ncbi:hypothetical protein [Micromonospora rosaria]|uniref:hypothetical protein n=1 Tax=Micromonospora rosaria TaxID=47874 RepID=UPI000B18C855|nr:hypothetical protein [Micromonospora rosaria]
MIRHHPSAAALVLHVVGEVASWEARQVLDDTAWDAAHELDPYRTTPDNRPDAEQEPHR